MSWKNELSKEQSEARKSDPRPAEVIIRELRSEWETPELTESEADVLVKLLKEAEAK